jgi:3-dehydroquinate synthase
MEWMLNAANGSSRILAGESLDRLPGLLPESRCVIVTDPEVRRLHAPRFPDLEIIEVGRGEAQKTSEAMTHVYRECLRLGLDRSSFLVGIGGGIVCDIAGFAAATYMRGLDFGAVPTTLLAQCDAGLGGKTGINFQGRKNLIGVFRQPKFVLCDPTVLSTLPEPEIRHGLAEVIKHGAILDPGLFGLIEDRGERMLGRDPQALGEAVKLSLRIKSSVVESDPLEQGRRRLLNFGHTLGHAVEATAGLPHGEAVAAGMAAAARISLWKGWLRQEDFSRLTRLLAKLGLPDSLPAGLDGDTLDRAVRADKKRRGDGVIFVLLREIGKAETVIMSFSELKEHIHDLCKRG